MLSNLAVALITHGRIKTTLSKAKALRPFIEKVITLAKKANQANDSARKLHFRRLAIARVRDKKIVAVLFDEKVTEFLERPGGYTRIYKLGQRLGDAAEMALIEFIDANDEGYAKPAKKATKPQAKKAKKEASKKEAPEVEAEVEAEVEVEALSDKASEPEAEKPEAEEATEESKAE
jgi:large subunit ribosomal protein L17